MEGSMANVIDSVREQVLPNARQQPLDERRLAAWIGKALLVQGKIVSTENLTIDGSVEGTIELGDHSLTIGAGASIKADLVAQTIIISGAVTGNVKANVKVDLRATGSVNGDIVAPVLVMADGAVITGGVDVRGKGSIP
jgi:cytoskeletal protein CcmA (bactofilin family)